MSVVACFRTSCWRRSRSPRIPVLLPVQFLHRSDTHNRDPVCNSVCRELSEVDSPQRPDFDSSFESGLLRTQGQEEPNLMAASTAELRLPINH